MNYPLLLRFRILTLAPKVDLEDADGRPVLHVKQKLFRLKEKVEVFADEAHTRLMARIGADRMIDWSASYVFTTPEGREFGRLRRQGLKSLWRAHYEVTAGDSGGMTSGFGIREENPMAKLMDGLLGGIPVLGLATGYFFHPSYLASRTDGTPVMRVVKRRAFLEGRFTVERLDPGLTAQEELSLLLGFLMMALLERQRG